MSNDPFAAITAEIAFKDFYNRFDYLAAGADIDQAIRIANGWGIAQKFPPWQLDYISAMRQILNFRSDDLSQFPGIKQMGKTLGQQSMLGPVLEGIAETEDYLDRTKSYWEQVFENCINPHFTDNPKLMDSPIIQEMIRGHKKQINIPLLKQNGIAQYHRQLQSQFRGYAIQALGESFGLLLRLCVENDWELQVRPTISHHSSHSASIQSYALRNAFYDIGKYRTNTQIELHEALRVNGLAGILLDNYEYSPSHESAAILRELYWNFYLDAAYIRLRSITNPDLTIQIGPRNLPPMFFGTKGDKMPVIITPPRATMLWPEWVYAIHMTNTTSPTIINFNEDEFYNKAALLLPIITSCLTLISLTMSLGSGSHKPRWTQQVYNTEFMRAFPLAIAAGLRYALH